MEEVTDLIELADDTPYPPGAFSFVNDGLAFTVERVHGEEGAGPKRHVTGRDLCHGLRDLAVQRYGLLARAVLKHWNITCCEDFGNIVFHMVNHEVFSATEEDSLDDFASVFDFAEAFDRRLLLSENG